MGNLSHAFDAVSGWSWVWLFTAFLASMVFESWPTIRYRFWQWRIDRALRQRGQLFEDELRDFRWKQGDPPRPFDFGNVLAVSLQTAVQLFLPVIFVDTVSDEDLLLVPAAAAAAAWVMQSRQPRDETDEEWEGPGGYEVPREAKIGFLAAIAMLGVIAIVVYAMRP